MEAILKKISGAHVLNALKITIAGVASALAARFLGLSEGCWAAISAFVVIGGDLGATFTASRDRLIGTAVGAAMGTVVAINCGGHLVCFGAATMATVLVCETLAPGPSHRLGCVTIAIVMLVTNTGSAWHVSLRRVLEVVLGILVALVISAVPPQSVDNH